MLVLNIVIGIILENYSLMTNDKNPFCFDHMSQLTEVDPTHIHAHP